MVVRDDWVNEHDRRLLQHLLNSHRLWGKRHCGLNLAGYELRHGGVCALIELTEFFARLFAVCAHERHIRMGAVPKPTPVATAS